MRIQGRICIWRDERAYGFILPDGSNKSIFVHFREFTNRTRRPVEGDVVTYEPTRDDRGRPCAHAVDFVGLVDVVEEFDVVEKAPETRKRSYIDAFPIAITVAFVSFLVAETVSRRVPLPLFAVYPLASVIAFQMYAKDKQAARQRKWRTRERALLLIAFLGGWPGAVAAQQWFRHKTSKRAFQIFFWFLVVYNVAALAWLASPNVRQYVRTSIEEIRVNLTPAPKPAKSTKPTKPKTRRRAPSNGGWSSDGPRLRPIAHAGSWLVLAASGVKPGGAGGVWFSLSG